MVGIAALTWGGFLFYATNNERANSSVVRSLQFQLKASPAVTEFLGDDVRLVPILGEFKRVDGSVSLAFALDGRWGCGAEGWAGR